ncbi:MAG: hypothetical protein QG608_1509 [Actinomycetota bacterium]|nr:hypothetical protein [Actinomycetota bacterium]
MRLRRTVTTLAVVVVASVTGVLTAGPSRAAIHLPVVVEVLPTARLVAGGVAVDITVIAQCDRLDDPGSGYYDEFWVDVQQQTPLGMSEAYSPGMARCDTQKHRYVLRAFVSDGDPALVRGNATVRGIGPGTPDHYDSYITTRTVVIKS